MGPLPAKQNGIFKKILKCYDYKQYKMGLKLARQILANPETANHGETLAMKGLILNCMGKKDEAYENVKKGLRNDLMSHVCWHVYGLLQRSEHKYDEAIKCYRNALKYDKDNITILRDLSLLQIQMRDLEGFRDTRYQLFMLRSAQRVSWLSFAAAYHLLEDHATAAKILDEFRRTQRQQKEQNNINNSDAESEDTAVAKKSAQTNEPIDYEQSELLLYQVMILMEAKTFKEALDFLNRNSAQICDRLAVLECKAQILIELSRNAEATKLIQDHLIARNQENLLYYQLLERALNLNSQDEVNRQLLYLSLQQKYPRSQIPFKIPLVFVNKLEVFEPIVDAYLKKFIRKCLPALFRNLRPVYNDEYQKLVTKFNQEYLEHKKKRKCGSPTEVSCTDLFYISSSSTSEQHRCNRVTLFKRYGIPDKIKIIEELNLKYVKNLLENTSFESLPETTNSENKTNILWVYFYLAQHYDYIGNYEKALEYVKIAIEHTPTLIELLTLKGKIYKHLSEVDKAAEQVNEGQRFDTADRYLNSKCAKYLLRANKISLAEEMCSKFTRAGVSVTENLNEMQCMWFQIETAKAHYRMKAYGMALKKCYEIDAFFSEVTEDQFDFHTYCMRKMTLRSYIKLLRMEDVLRSHRFYFEAAQIAINIYLGIYDQPQTDSKENKNSNIDSNALSAHELKKIKNKERKLAAKQQQNQKNSSSKSNNDGDVEKQNLKSTQKNSKADSQQSAVATNKQSSEASRPDDTPEVGLDPSILEHPKDPLEKAVRFLIPLKTLAQNQIDTQLLSFEVYKRKNKILLMLQSVKRALKLEPYHSRLQDQLVEFIKIAETTKKSGNLAKPIESVLELELPKLQLALLSPCK